MKAICIIGSPKAYGSTAYVVDKIIDGMVANKIEVKNYVLGMLKINYCKGCTSCYETRRCVQRDDMDLLVQDLFEADIVLVASPSYWGDITGQLKVFIDRCLPLCNARTGETPVPSEKIGISVALRAGQKCEETQHILDAIEHFFGHLGIKPVERFSIEGIDTVQDYAKYPDKIKEAYRIGKTILAKKQSDILDVKEVRP